MSLLTLNSRRLEQTAELSDSAINEELIFTGVLRESYKPSHFVEKICQDRYLLAAWHKSIMENPSPFDDFLANPSLNRFPNVICLDKSRVKLSERYGKGDYCHASYVDSYEKRNGYILSQAPFSPITEEIFWRMIIDVKPKVVLVLGSLRSANGPNMKRFWPEHGGKNYANHIETTLVHTEKTEEIDIMGIRVSARKKELFRLPLVLLKAWKEDSLLPDLTRFRATVKEIEKISPNRNGPTVMVCASGATRCGTYAAVDVILTRITKELKVGVQQTIEIILGQRYGCFQFIEHYKAIHEISRRFCMSLTSKSNNMQWFK